MSEIFLRLVNMSITASFLTVAVMLIRYIFKKAPKYVRLILWSFVGIRLIFPYSFESVFSLIPSSEPISITADSVFPIVKTGIPATDSTLGTGLSALPEGSISHSHFDFGDMLDILSIVWLSGIVIMLICFAASSIMLKRKTAEKFRTEKGIYVCDRADTPFVLGIIRPQIILPASLNECDRDYVLSHEKTHIKRLDHIWKPLGYMLLSVYWFNPVLWAAYYYFCRDIELACDEKVIRDMSKEEIKGYTSALLNCSVRGKLIAVCSPAFGEAGIRERIRTALNYKKPAFRVILVSVIALVLVALCFLTDPPKTDDRELNGVTVISSGSEYEDVSIEITEAELTGIRPYIKVKWKNSGNLECDYGAPYDILMKNENGEWVSTVSNDIWTAIAYLLPSNGASEKIYYLSNDNIPDKGVYRFESYFNAEKNGVRSEIYTVFIEFETEAAVEEAYVRQFGMKDVIYDNGSFSSVTNADILPDIRISPNMVLSVNTDNGWQEMGILSEITLSKDNFDKRIWHSGVTDQISAVDIRADNKRAWQLQVNGGRDTDNSLLYVLLEQEDGMFLFGSGYYNEMGLTEPNSDYSYLRWICSIEERSPV